MRPRTEFASPATVKLALEQRAQVYLSARRTTDNPEMYIKASALIAAAAASYTVLVFVADSLPVAMASGVVLALALVGIGFNVQHDGNHGGFSRLPWVNRAAGFTLDLIGASSYFWKDKHNHSHHVYTNLPHQDADIDLGGLARLSDGQRWLWFHQYQHWYLWFLYAFVHLRYLYSDIQRLAFGKKDGLTAKYPAGATLAALLAGKAVFLSLAIALPLTRHGWASVALAYVGVSMIMGVIFSIVFQLAHSVDVVDHPSEADDHHREEWVRHQIGTTANFATGNRWLTMALGGLNFQREHHLFPKVSHVHYPALARVVREVCVDYAIECRENPTVWAALRSHYRFVRLMGLKPAVVAAS